MAFIVQKFGGTSVANPAARSKLLSKVAAAAADGGRVAVVVSAMGRKGDPYATDSLLSLLDEVSAGAPGGAATASPVDPLIRDFLAASGELISASLVAALLEARGVRARPLSAYTAGIRAEGPFGDAEITVIDPEPIRRLLEAGIVPVVAGFQGVAPDGNLVTLGRGGSDTSAVGLGAFLKADYVDIYTDVPGVAAADPRIVPEARFLPYLSYGEMYRLALNGARVLHDKSATLGERHGVLIRVRSSFDDGEGSLIGPARPGETRPALLGIALQGKGPEPVTLATLFAAGRRREHEALVNRLGAELGCEALQGPDGDAVLLRCPAAAAPELARRLYAALAPLG
jgi:aspartate kinase